MCNRWCPSSSISCSLWMWLSIISSIFSFLRSWQASSHVPLLDVVYSFSDIVSYFLMFSGKSDYYKNFQGDPQVCILETLASFFAEYNTIFKVILFVFVGSSVILCCSFSEEYHLTPAIYCNGSSIFPLFLSESAIPSPAIKSIHTSGYTFPLSLMKWRPVMRKHLVYTL